VPNCLAALQKIASHHRNKFDIPVIGITGSNGKTIVKEWLYQLLQPMYRIVRSPRSFNSQIGVPLSVWKMDDAHELAIFEAGISTTHEMEHLTPIIKPTIGVLTHMGPAHAEGFKDTAEKIKEKLQLFETVDKFIYGKDQITGVDIEGPVSIFKKSVTFYSWSRTAPATLVVTSEKIKGSRAQLTLLYAGELFEVEIPFTDKASIDNAVLCMLTLCAMGKAFSYISRGITQLTAVDMRMQFKKGINNCTFI